MADLNKLERLAQGLRNARSRFDAAHIALDAAEIEMRSAADALRDAEHEFRVASLDEFGLSENGEGA